MALLVLVTIPAEAQPAPGRDFRFRQRFEDLRLPGAPFYVVSHDYRVGLDEEQREQLIVPITVRNTGTSNLDEAVIQIRFYTSEGTFRGTHMVGVQQILAGGEANVEAHVPREIVRFDASDSIVVLPFRARIKAYVWKRDLRDVAQQPGMVKILSSDLSCETKCDLKFDQCANVCTGGVKEFSCSCCGAQVCSYTCKCYPPPP